MAMSFLVCGLGAFHYSPESQFVALAAGLAAIRRTLPVAVEEPDEEGLAALEVCHAVIVHRFISGAAWRRLDTYRNRVQS